LSDFSSYTIVPLEPVVASDLKITHFEAKRISGSSKGSIFEKWLTNNEEKKNYKMQMTSCALGNLHRNLISYRTIFKRKKKKRCLL
jgi:hypothetical protein